MADSLTREHKLAFADAVLAVLTSRAPEVARPFNEAFTHVRNNPTQRDVDTVYQDLLDWSRDLSPTDRREISESLEKKIGLSLHHFDKNRIARIEKIVERGFLRTDDEWRLIDERLQELSSTAAYDVEEIKILDRLLATYPKKKV